jgi:phosphatidylserine/phosphatidylglycerophosphate/cardiolipin synthase-like enzyme
VTAFGPLTDPSLWILDLPGLLDVPEGLRHAGTPARILRGSATAPALVRIPLAGVVRLAPIDAGATTAVELTVNPIPIRTIAAALPGGLPTLFMLVPTASLTLAAGYVGAGDAVATTDVVQLLAVHPDRICRDPTRWVDDLLQALVAAAAETAGWAPFADRVTALAAGDDAPVLLLDHSGRPAGIPRPGGGPGPVTDSDPLEVDVVLTGTGTTHRIGLQSSDGGDLQKAMARAAAAPGGPPVSTLFARPAALRPVSTASGAQLQFAAETGESAPGQLDLTRGRRSFMTTDLHAWFAPQRAVPTGDAEPALARFSRGNHLQLFTRGRDYFHDLMRSCRFAANAPAGSVADSQFHLAGWSIDHDLVVAVPGTGDPADLPTSVLAAATAITEEGGRSRFLAPRMIQAEPGAALTDEEVVAAFIALGGLLVLGSTRVGDLDGSGAAIITVLAITNPALFRLLLGALDGFEQNKPAIDALKASQLTGSSAVLTAYPARLEDNTVAPPSAGFPFDFVLRNIRKFGLHHTKLAVVRWTDADGRHDIGYCGGIDIWPDRLDDERHLTTTEVPFHDVHARLEGPAVRDLAVTFRQYHNHEVATDQVPELPAASTFGTDGTVAVQVARTYFAAAPGSGRAYPFAPQGDRALADTMLAAINNAREFIYIEDQYLTPPQQYQDALLAKVASGDLRALVAVIPGLADQPFGQIVRDPFVQALYDQAAPSCTVRIGYPRLHHTLADNQNRASSGRCRLLEAMTRADGFAVLGPAERVPVPPFWLAVDGELMYVIDEVIGGEAPGKRRLLMLRGESTGFLRGSGLPPGSGVRVRAHDAGAAATVVAFPSVYVHAKMMIVDDVFLSIGSANLNRRGLFHDGETNVFAIPHALRFDPTNPIQAMRATLWAEMLDLPRDLAAPLLTDPTEALALFDRSPFAGNRFTPLSAYPEQLMFGASTGDGLGGLLLQLSAAISVIANHRKLFDAVIDPSSATESQA